MAMPFMRCHAMLCYALLRHTDTETDSLVPSSAASMHALYVPIFRSNREGGPAESDQQQQQQQQQQPPSPRKPETATGSAQPGSLPGLFPIAATRQASRESRWRNLLLRTTTKKKTTTTTTTTLPPSLSRIPSINMPALDPQLVQALAERSVHLVARQLQQHEILEATIVSRRRRRRRLQPTDGRVVIEKRAGERATVFLCLGLGWGRRDGTGWRPWEMCNQWEGKWSGNSCPRGLSTGDGDGDDQRLEDAAQMRADVGHGGGKFSWIVNFEGWQSDKSLVTTTQTQPQIQDTKPQTKSKKRRPCVSSPPPRRSTTAAPTSRKSTSRRVPCPDTRTARTTRTTTTRAAGPGGRRTRR
ncbi:hypothetical protein MBM_01271 [Drepanopeziza brunnea f. sp. 'multigermtubi' MB_m1]|uniref:Uncharacterized protein n=1 Tax=Marssonina brunnea f. sp. multigermtubi (strain MB_m1) TaxID=1072389 RepID=K1Y5X4_MARBU|nr:uncharacterized protein MBM_01271 [Drepanopeziza brunnea f. sp. 'multigermtubi' MB_m1]EKD20589.1 hypothetical protein MBM_01271 [Drepanopeziza brunnea f. sp. 'multigermtubi' MB_m1]